VRNNDHIFYPRNDTIGNPASDHSVYPLANTLRSGRPAAGETIMPAPPEFMVLLYSMTVILIAMTLAYIIVWWMHRRDPL